MKHTIIKSALLCLLAATANDATAQLTDHAVQRDNTQNQVLLKLSTGSDKYYNTADLQYIDIDGADVTVRHNSGDDIYAGSVADISFFKADKPAGLTKADLTGQWVVKGQEEQGEESFSYTFTDEQLTFSSYGEVQYSVPYTLQNGILSYTIPANQWGDPAQETSVNVSLLYDKSVLVMKSKAYGDDNPLEEAQVFFKIDKTPDTSAAALDGKWFCYHHGSKDEVRTGLWIDGDKAEFIIGAWATRMVGTYTYSNGILTLHPTDYYTGRSPDEWGYGRIDPATLECPQWDKIDNPGYPETFEFIVNGDEAYGWYANLPCTYYKQ